MWLFTEYGFVSVVCARLDGGLGDPDPDNLMVRARSVAHLEALQREYPEELGRLTIQRTEHTDYPARLFVAKDTFARVMLGLVEQIDYDNFKGRLTRTKQHEYHDACSSVWGVMHRLQPPRRKNLYTGSLFSQPATRAWYDRLGETRGEPSQPVKVPRQTSARENRTEPNGFRIPQPDDVVVVCEWSLSGNLYAPVCVLTDLAHYSRSRVAARDAANLGWCRRVPRSRLLLQRMSPTDARQKYPTLTRHSMRNVVPSKGQQGGRPGIPSGSAQPSLSRGPTMSEPQQRVIGTSIAAQAKPAKVEINKRPAPLVEDTSVIGGLDEQTGAPVIRPRTPEGVADEATRATDPREGHS